VSKILHYDFLNDKSLAGKVGPTLICTRAGLGATYRNASGVRVAAAANEARFDHDSSGNSLGVLSELARTNLFLNSDAPATQNITTTAQQYTVTVEGSGTVTLSGTATGVASEGSPLTVTATAGTLTCTVAGGPDWVQVEAGSFPTSMIQTAGSPVTREKDQIQALSWSDFATSGEGSIYVDCYKEFLNPAIGFAFALSNGLDDRFYCYNNTGGTTGRVQTKPAVGNGGLLSQVMFAADTQVRIAAGYELNSFIGYYNGNAFTEDTTVDPPNAADVDRISIGMSKSSGSQFCGHIREFAYFDDKKTAETLEDYSLNGLPAEGNRNYLAVTRRQAQDMKKRQRIGKARKTLRGEFE